MHTLLKSFVLMLFLMVGSLSLKADSWVVMGAVDVLQSSKVECAVYYDFSKTRVGNVSYDAFVGDMRTHQRSKWNQEILAAGLKQFVESWNHVNPNGLQTTLRRDTHYSLVIAPTFLDLSHRKAMFGRRGARIDGFILVYHDNDLILKVAVSQEMGRCYRSKQKRVRSLMRGLANHIIEDVK